MRRNFFKSICVFFAMGLLVTATSCENDDVEFDDYNYQTVYFAHPTPIRTITLGTDEYSTELDNLHKFRIYAASGGFYSNKNDRTLEIVVDNSLCDGIVFENGSAVLPMPKEYYTLSSNTITIPAGKAQGAVDVQLADAYFNDPLSVSVNYVIPLRIVSSKDSILAGRAKPTIVSPYRLNSSDWDVAPHDYVLYAVKYKNKYHGAWLTRGTDEIDLNGVKSTVKREAQYLEKNELRYLRTVSLNKATYELSTIVDVDTTKWDEKAGKFVTSKEKKTLKGTFELTFDGSDKCQMVMKTPGCSGNGTGVWEFEAAKKAWNNKDRDQLTLDYNITFRYTDDGRPRYKTFKTHDILVMQSRESKREDFAYKLK